MAHYHFTVKPRSRKGGKSTVEQLAYRSGTDLLDARNGETYYYSKKGDVFHVDILLPEGAPQWIVDIALECQSDKQSALQKFSNIIEAAEKRKDSRVYREAQFALPNELTNDQNIAWSKEFVRDYFTAKGMVAIINYHYKVNEETGAHNPHCHVLLSTRNLTEDGFSPYKNLDWNSDDLVIEERQQYEQYQNAALKEHGFEARVDHRSLKDQGLDVDPQTKLGKNVREMTARGIETDKQKIFDMVRLKNQFKIVKNPEIVFSIVTANHSTFTRKDIAKVLHRYIDDATQFQILYDRLVNSKELVDLESLGIHKQTEERVYTTQEMLRIEMNLVQKAETLAAQETHLVSPKIVEKVIAKYNQKLQKYGGLSTDQQAAIRHMLASTQISCVVGFAGAGKTTCLEAVREAWEEAGYRIIGLAPTGKAAQNIEGCGIRSMTIHRFLYAQKDGREKLTPKTIVVGDEFGMVDSRRCSELLSLIDRSGAKIVPMGDGHQAQSVEAGPAFRLLTDRVKPAILEKVVRQQIEWQREATRLFGVLQTRKALELYQENGFFTTITEKAPDLTDKGCLIDNFCLSRQMSGRIWKEMVADFEAEYGTTSPGTDASGKGVKFDPETDFEVLAKHQDFPLFQEWKSIRETLVLLLINDYDNQQEKLKERGVDVKALDALVTTYKETLQPDPAIFEQIEVILRQMSYDHIADTRGNTRESLIKAWVAGYEASPDETHLMLAFTNKDANKLNEVARTFMREQGKIQGKDYEFVTQRIETDDFEVEYRTYHDRTFAKGDRILFTRNNNSLKVKNGTLGTILSLDQKKIRVKLDRLGEKEGETISFSPNLYPFIDNGWATTIIKAQGVTVDHVKLLASFEQYRNLAYVGMSRHRLTLQVFGSKLDFWREEKIIDRLSRVQEKLSGLDYLDTDKIQEKLKEDTAILWHLLKINQAKDFWKAIKFTAWDVLGKAFGRPQESKIEDEGFQSFDDTEEVRSRDFFKTPSDATQNGSSSQAEYPQSQEQPEGRQGEKKEEKQEDKQRDTDKPSGSPVKTQQDNTDHTRQQGHKPLDPKGNEVESSIGPSPASPPLPSPSPSPSSSLSDKTFKEKLKAVQDKINSDYATQTVIKEKSLSYKEVEALLKERIYELATSILGEPNKHSRNSAFIRFGELDEFAVGVREDKQGTYTNFVSGDKGGPLKLIEDQVGLSSAKDALRWGAEWLGGNPVVVEQRIVTKPLNQREQTVSTWKPIVPIPNNAPEPDIVGNKYLNVMLQGGNKVTSRHAYRDEQGNLLGYVVRIEKPPVVLPDGSIEIKKVTPPLAYGEDARGYKYWKWQAFYEKENRTPYGLEKLAQGQSTSKPVLVVEGEKTADKAQENYPEFHVLTWLGGAGAVDKTNWACLVGRQVTIWPDYDYDHKSQKAAQKLHQTLTQLNRDAGKQGPVGVVELSEDLRHGQEALKDGWDLADPLPEGWTLDTVRNMIREALPQPCRHQDHTQDKGQQDQRKDTLKEYQNPDPLLDKREQFEKLRLPINQEWCASLGFMVQYKRLPETAEELSAAYWQGERLTAIEGRLYREALEGNKKVNEKQLTLRARTELAKNQIAPDYILAFGQSFDLTESQLKQLEQHALILQDKSSQPLSPSELDRICQAIKVHSQMMEAESICNKPGGQLTPTNQTQGMPQETSQRSTDTNATDIYRTLIEQQAILGKMANRSEEINKGEKIILKEGMDSMLLKAYEIRDSCLEKLQRINEKAQKIKVFNQEMKDFDQSRQNQRGIDM